MANVARRRCPQIVAATSISADRTNSSRTCARSMRNASRSTRRNSARRRPARRLRTSVGERVGAWARRAAGASGGRRVLLDERLHPCGVGWQHGEALRPRFEAGERRRARRARGPAPRESSRANFTGSAVSMQISGTPRIAQLAADLQAVGRVRIDRRRRSARATSRIVARRSACVLRPDTKPDCAHARASRRAARSNPPSRSSVRPTARARAGVAARRCRRRSARSSTPWRCPSTATMSRASRPRCAAGSGRCGRTRRARRSRWSPGSGAAIGRPICARDVAGADVAEIAGRHGEVDRLRVGARGLEIAGEVVDDLRRDPRPVDRIDRADA